jgi:16S rRNA (guanine1207-N2)-methyltransferase
MDKKEDHYFKEYSNSSVKFYSVSVSLRRHLYIFKTTSGIFSYKKLDLGTKVLIENMFIPKNEQILLDLGCGYGTIGIVLAYESPKSKIYLTDTNRRALWCAKQNIQFNLPQEKGRIKILFGKDFEPFKDKGIQFDGIYMNPPVRLGRKQFLKLFEDLPQFLKKKGNFQFVLRKKMGSEYVYNYLIDAFSEQQIKIICKRSGYWVFNYIQV